MAGSRKHSIVGIGGWMASIIGVVASVLALSACGGDGGNPRAEALSNMVESAGSDAYAPCFTDVLAQFDDATLGRLIDGDSVPTDVMEGINSGYNSCIDSTPAPATTFELSGDPELDALAADPLGWWQERQNEITAAICASDRAALLDVVSASSANLAAFEDVFGECLDVTVVKVASRDGGTSPDSFRLGDGLHFYVTDSGWSGDNHEWSASFVLEDGRWKLLNG